MPVCDFTSPSGRALLQCPLCGRTNPEKPAPAPAREVTAHTVVVDAGPPRRQAGLVVLDHHRTGCPWRIQLADTLDETNPVRLRNYVLETLLPALTAPARLVLVVNAVGDATLTQWSRTRPAAIPLQKVEVAGYPGEPTRVSSVTRQDLAAAITEATADETLSLPGHVIEALRGWEGRPADGMQVATNVEDADVLVLPAAVAIWHARRSVGTGIVSTAGITLPPDIGLPGSNGYNPIAGLQLAPDPP